MKIEHEEHRGFYILNEHSERIAELLYHEEEGTDIYYRTYVSSELRGQGIADQLFQAAVHYARKTGRSMGATCSYVVRKLEQDDYTDVRSS